MAKRSYTIDPAVAHERARKGRAVQNSIDYHIDKIVAALPALNTEQRQRLGALFGPSSDAA
jgi:hypothetical protein